MKHKTEKVMKDKKMKTTQTPPICFIDECFLRIPVYLSDLPLAARLFVQ